MRSLASARSFAECSSNTGTATSKRQRLMHPTPLSLATFSATPSPRTPAKEELKSSAASRSQSRRSRIPSLLHAAVVTEEDWHPLYIPRSELSLSLTLPTGQTFRWRRTGPSEFTGVVGPHLISLKHDDEDPLGRVSFLLHASSTSFSSSATAAAARSTLNDYLNLEISLAEMWRGFAVADPRFAELSNQFEGGARVLRQDPVECVFQFLCSSNNNIGRIGKMVGFLSSFGEYLGNVGGFDFHEFPSLERLSVVSEQQLREAGFGYRAKYIVGAVKVLQAKPDGGMKWLTSLRHLELHDVVETLCKLPGVGPKVAACIALFSLDQHHAIPVDTHVWKIAKCYLMPELADKKLSPKLCSLVSKAFIDRFGKYAGWAQNVLFIGELPSQKGLFSPEVSPSKECKNFPGNMTAESLKLNRV